ncbi:LLM class flavin-dependent oxidoreductase [Salibacterium salarium]|uniref:LLM class flavin-dependent oxidoreductase n=1 Tax=Salibacterium salarium TaxID=284579 RepID=A0A428N8I7_9BACI|nr:LLM class flavin-dependent oxidoreductase [Salibacterium salarium]RSL34714.1 LLM class flavin-dependent oxidoreductase [Salibacterium salarium]
MKLSILDQSPIASGQTAGEALQESVKLAQMAERLGYTRYWLTEHHDLEGIAGSVPEIMLSYVGALTQSIRLGTGAVLLPHYKPYKVAETHNMLATLFPGRIDVGIGRAPGGSAEATNVLSDNFLQNVGKMPELTRELLHFLDDDYPSPNKYSDLSASPVPDVSPTPWLLGTSKKSGLLAAEYGMAYPFAQFMSDDNGQDVIQQYRDEFTPRKSDQPAHVIVAVSVVCATTSAKASEIAKDACLWSLQKEKAETDPLKKEFLTHEEKQKAETMQEKMIIGHPQEVAQQLLEVKEKYQADEIMIITTTRYPLERQQSYRLIAEEMLDGL